MFDDDSYPTPDRPASRLLDELESIKGTLSNKDSAGLPADIPLLDDMVIGNLNDNANLLNLGQIFDEDENLRDEPTVEASRQFPRFTLDVAISDDNDLDVEPAPATPKPRIRPDYSREVLIQEIVDEFIPRIEAELHRRLQQLDDTALRHLKDSN